jgi:hypothetical protein
MLILGPENRDVIGQKQHRRFVVATEDEVFAPWNPSGRWGNHPMRAGARRIRMAGCIKSPSQALQRNVSRSSSNWVAIVKPPS